MGCSHSFAPSDADKRRFNKNMEEAMTNALITRSNRQDTGRPEVAVIEATAKEQELELASAGPGGVLKELALARWRGLTTQVPGPSGERR